MSIYTLIYSISIYSSLICSNDWSFSSITLCALGSIRYFVSLDLPCIIIFGLKSETDILFLVLRDSLIWHDFPSES